MNILVIGSGGVGAAAAAIARRRDFFEHMTMTDIDEARARAVAEGTGDARFAGARIDASDEHAIAAFAAEHHIDVIFNAAIRGS